MKHDLRIKLMQEINKAKKLKELQIACDNDQSFIISKKLKEQVKKLEFIKKLSNYL